MLERLKKLYKLGLFDETGIKNAVKRPDNSRIIE